MAVTITSAMPQMVSYGFDDKSGGQTVRNIQPSPDHCPIFLIQAERGPISSEVPAVYISDGGMRTSLFGTKTFDPTGSYATHQTIGSNVVMEHANSHFLTRLWPSNGGPKASIRFSLHVKHEDIPVWLRNADGSIVTTALGSKVQDGNLTVPGATLAVIADPVPANNFGKATIGNVSPLGAGAKVYPIIDKEVTWYGSYGNNQAVTMYPATTKTAEPINIEMFEATRAFPFKMSLLERDSALTTPTVISRISGERTLDFTFKPKSLYRPLGKELYLSRVYRTAWADSTPGQTPIYGPFGRIAVYQEQIDLVLADLFALEKAANPEFTDIDMFADPDTEKYVMNFMTATTVNNVAYTAIQMADIVPHPTAVNLNEGNYVFATGASDGTMSLAEYNAAAAAFLKRFANKEDELADNIAKYPIMDFYDTGFDIDVKDKIIEMLSGRDQLFVYLSTHTVGSPELTASEESSLGLYLYTKLLAYPESVFHGTPTCRGQIFARSGEFLGSTFTEPLPLLFERMGFNCNAMGASSGVWDGSKIADIYPENVITNFSALNVGWVPPRQQNIYWKRGIVYPLDYDMQSKQMGANQTVYPDDSSVLNSYYSVKAACALYMIGHRLWREFRGSERKTPLQLAANIEKRFDELVFTNRKFGDSFLIDRKVIFTNDDVKRGYSWTLLVRLGGYNLKTVQEFALESYRYEDLEKLISLGQ
jgi:hypothetical protein